MPPSSNQLQDLPPQVAEMLPEIRRKTRSDSWKLIGRPMQRRECRIYFLGSEDAQLPGIVVKIYHPEADGRSPVRKLHKRGRQLKAASNAECTIPAPILFDEAKHALVMEFVHAPVAGQLLIRRFYSAKDREYVIRKAARWLKWFHDQSGVKEEAFAAGLFTRKIDKLLEKHLMRFAPARPSGDFASECISMAGCFASELDGTPILHATAHGDFTPFNLFLQGERAIGFDYRANRRLPVFHDMCRFLHYLDIYRFFPARTDEIRRCGCRLRDFETFMEAYSSPALNLDRHVWLKLHFMEITRRIISLSMPDASARKGTFRFIELAHLQRNARIILDTLS